jgi:methionyl-tRNA formyltransferase
MSEPAAKRKPEVVFFGSGPVAAKSLELLSTHCDIEAVVTKPQPPHHKEQFPVLNVAERLGLKTFTPYGKKELSALFASQPVSSKMGIVIDYGFIINQDVIDYFPLGIINSHFSLLPEWRGADPISFAILSGQKETGISLMLITAGMDEGPILAHAPFTIPENTTTPELTDYLIELSDWTLQDVLPGYIAGRISARPQEAAALPDHTATTYSRKLSKEDSVLDLSKPAGQLEREIRAFAEWPKSRIVLGGLEIIVTKAHVVASETPQSSTIWLDDTIKPKQFGLVTSNGVLVIDSLKPAGKQEMPAAAFLAGYRKQLDQA